MTDYQNLLPPLSTEEYKALKASIELHGVMNPVIVDEHGNVLDGHHRLAIDPKAPRRTVKGLSEAEKIAFVYQANFSRRNLSSAQKREALMAMKAVAFDLRRQRMTHKQIANALGVSRDRVSDWFRKAQRKDPELRKSLDEFDCRFRVPRRLYPIIVRRAKSGEPVTRIAADLKIARETARGIVKRYKKPTDVPPPSVDWIASAFLKRWRSYQAMLYRGKSSRSVCLKVWRDAFDAKRQQKRKKRREAVS